MEALKDVNLKTKAAYNKAGEKYYKLFHDEFDNKKYDRELISGFLGNFDSDAVLCDLGCGPCGHIEELISQKGIKVIGIDISEKCIEIAKVHHPDIQFEVGDFSKLGHDDDSFDGIISYYSIIDTPKKYMDEIFKEFHRVLKKGGYFLLAVKAGEKDGYEKELLGIETEIYYSLFSEKEVKSYLCNNNFSIIKLESRAPYDGEIKIERIFAVSQKE